MHLEAGAADQSFREEVRDFLNEHLSPELRQAGQRTMGICSPHAASQAWQKILYAKGWAAPSWPKEHGGTGWTPMQRHIFATECYLADAPMLAPMGLEMVAPAIMGHGSEAQKAYYLPRVLSAEDSWCQGYSEPGSGSDLASLQCRADRDGDDYIINGSKIWTTDAHYATRIFCLVRTSSEGKPQAGIFFILIDMDSPGIKVEPIITMAGNHEVNQVFFDDVRVPQENRVGAENEGWTVAKYLLEFERGGRAWGARLQGAMAHLRHLAEARDMVNGTFAQRLAGLAAAVQAVEYTEQRVIAEMSQTGRIGPASSMLKTCAGTLVQEIREVAVEVIGNYAAPYQPAAREWGSNIEPIGSPDELTVVAHYLDFRARSIAGGSNEVQRNIMAKLVLGM
ncbi:MAG: acyl-CoA dehydrogenase family protein [Alphaproteobacteria bacterium]|jgi:acyl-CoA dehydrogenase|nr:acyl-CoA dehydrogenase family protein [Alphaproteobacteria bacterium]MDP6832926.1 acyl-CoA dehydrogenase family protein [Alphaproteobacteria bacterium]